MPPSSFDVVIIGAGAAGLMCAIEAGKRGRRVAVIDHSKKTAEKIRISGGGRCNFTNIHTAPECFLSQNPHFCKSALSRYTPQDFIALIRKHKIAYHEKKLGQLFCDDSAQQIIDMLLHECRAAGVVIHMDTSVTRVDHHTKNGGTGGLYRLETSRGLYEAEALVIATGGLSIPKIGATKFGYDIARQFGLRIVPTRAGLVPLTFSDDILARCKDLSGVSVEASVRFQKTRFAEGMLFTHRGLSGPSILQISSYWREGAEISVNLADGVDALAVLKDRQKSTPAQDILTIVSDIIPRRLAVMVLESLTIHGKIAELSTKSIERVAAAINDWAVKPAGTEGYRTAEVTIGGVDTADLSSQTMESKTQKNLYFIGEVVDVTGHLGGFNFQWAWASGYAAGQVV